MLFDPRPKELRSELFDRDNELEALNRYASLGSPIILSLGIRRIGKTSVLKVFVNEGKYPALYIDARRLLDLGYSRQGLYRLLSEEFIKVKRGLALLMEYLRNIKGVTVAGHSIEFDWRNRELSITSILTKIDEYARDSGSIFIIIIDEAQYLRFFKGYNKIDFRQVIAYSYDNLKNVKFILAGSEIGLLYNFFAFTDASSPLYGRVRDEVKIERFSREKSIEFLELGFNEAGIQTPKTVIEEAINTLDGIPGWLAYFGFKFLQIGKRGTIEKILEEAVNIALDEIKKLSSYSQLYIHILRAIAMGFNNWSSIKKAVEAWIGKTLNDNTLYRLLNNLIDMSIISKTIDDKYIFLDPIYEKASKRL